MSEFFPKGFLDSISSAKGFEKEPFIRSHESGPCISIRLNPHKISEAKKNDSVVPWCQHGRYLSERPLFTADPEFHAGGYYVQEASSMALWMALEYLYGDNKNIQVLDLCAAPGGKSTLISTWLDGNGTLVSNDTIKSRASVLSENMSRWGQANTIVSNNDPKQFSLLPGFFDLIVVDAPCSGSGMFRKNPISVGEWSTENVFHCASRQKRILQDIWPSLKPGGVLIYSTCSYSTEENENISDFIKNTFSATHISLPNLEKQHPGIVIAEMGYRFYPNKLEGEGFYCSAFRKSDESRAEKINRGINQKNIKTIPLPHTLNDWLTQKRNYVCLESHLGINLVENRFLDNNHHLLFCLHILKFGVSAGKMAGKDFNPDHDLAMSLVLNDQIPSIHVDEKSAIKYLKKENFSYNQTKKGWALIKYNQLSLGWAKALPNRLNNYLPKNWRIIKDF